MRRLLTLALVSLALGATLLASTLVFSDTFSVAVDTNLASHTPTPTGAGWSEVVDTNGAAGMIADDPSDTFTASPSCSSCLLIYTATPSPALSGADYDQQFSVTALNSAQTDDDPVFMVARYVGAANDNYYSAGFTTEATPRLIIAKRVSGTTTILASSTAFTPAIADVFKFSVRGDTLKLYQNDNERLCVVDSSLSAAGSPGIGMGAVWDDALADAGTGLNRGDNYTVTDFTGEGGDDDCGGEPPPPTSTPGRLILLGIGGLSTWL